MRNLPTFVTALLVTFVTLVAPSGAAQAAEPMDLVEVTAERAPSACIPGFSFTTPDPGGQASFSADYGNATFAFPVPTSIPADGVSFPMTITGQGTNYAPSLKASGALVADGPVEVAPYWRADPGQPAVGGSESKTVTLKPSSSATAEFYVGLSFCSSFTYKYEQKRCGPRVARAARQGRAVNEVRVIAVQPDVQYHRAGCPEDSWMPVEKDTVLQQGDEISCDPDGSVTLQFADNSTVVIKNTTQLKIASFFTEGGVVRTEILLKMGEIAAQVNRSEATKSDFRIKNPTGTTSVRGTKFSVFYDPGSKAMTETTTEGLVEVDPVGAGLPTVEVPAGKEVEVLPRSMSKVVKAGTAGAVAGVTRKAALAKVRAIIAKQNAKCGVTTPFLDATAVKAIRGGWSVSVRVTGKLKGASTWTVKGRKVTPVNALAQKLDKGCPPAKA